MWIFLYLCFHISPQTEWRRGITHSYIVCVIVIMSYWEGKVHHLKKVGKKKDWVIQVLETLGIVSTQKYFLFNPAPPPTHTHFVFTEGYQMSLIRNLGMLGWLWFWTATHRKFVKWQEWFCWITIQEKLWKLILSRNHWSFTSLFSSPCTIKNQATIDRSSVSSSSVN